MPDIIDAAVGVASDEFSLRHEFGKVDFLGQGSDGNIGRCEEAIRLCIPTTVDKLRVLNPDWLSPAGDPDYLFVLNDGRLVENGTVTRLLRECPGLRLGLDPDILDTHSLRAGGFTAMADAGFAEHEIQRRGRWASTCWKIYCWGTRSLGSRQRRGEPHGARVELLVRAPSRLGQGGRPSHGVRARSLRWAWPRWRPVMSPAPASRVAPSGIRPSRSQQ